MVAGMRQVLGLGRRQVLGAGMRQVHGAGMRQELVLGLLNLVQSPLSLKVTFFTPKVNPVSL